MRQRAFGTAVKFGNLFWRQHVIEFIAKLLEDFTLFFKRKPV